MNQSGQAISKGQGLASNLIAAAAIDRRSTGIATQRNEQPSVTLLCS